MFSVTLPLLFKERANWGGRGNMQLVNLAQIYRTMLFTALCEVLLTPQ